jgi:calcineurin-like phosphoesterase family protein
MRKTFVSSDHHFYHKNILKFCGETRPFEHIDEHNEQLIVRHNEVVSDDDDVYFLGDFAFTDAETIGIILDMMNGRKHFIFGNHDKQMRKPSIAKHFVWMRDYHELKMPNRSDRTAPIVLSHYPMFSWNRMHHGALHFYGHTHGGVPHMFEGRGRDIGVDTNDCYPHNVDDLVDQMGILPIVDARDRVKREDDTK